MRGVAWTSRGLHIHLAFPLAVSLHTLSYLYSPFLRTLSSHCQPRRGAAGHAWMSRMLPKPCCQLRQADTQLVSRRAAAALSSPSPAPPSSSHRPPEPSADVSPTTRRGCAAAASSRRGHACVDVDAPIAGATQSRSARTPSCSRRGGGG
ncbi:hypothetical protein B0H16DRAFT_1587498 [Mycena metata]|uniref:Uncharacterized protein n=1 Tax=Mycena metata TaxID=1033252 RepID=A0AAD7HV25_9AGAR|nr:hypothetical protein B0H16DRAFT_1587498 [Mycena metata]